MARPIVGSVAEQLYSSLEPVTYADESLDWPMLRFFQAIGLTIQEIEDIVRDSDDLPGWGVIFSPDLAPAKALPWLAQLVGVKLPGGLTETQQRQRINDTAGWTRGSPAAIEGAVKSFLTGNKTVIFAERDGGAYQLTIITRTAETPNSAAVLAAILEQKPAGIVLNYVVSDGLTYLELRATKATYTAVLSSYATYTALRGF